MKTVATINTNASGLTKLSDFVDDKMRAFIKAQLGEKKNRHLAHLEEALLEMVATLDIEEQQQSVIPCTLHLLNAKIKLNKIKKAQKKLQENTLPPSSVRFTTLKLSSSDPEVVASEEFRDLRAKFNEGLEKFQTLAKDLFLTTKGLERVQAEQNIVTIFENQYHIINQCNTTIQIEAIMTEDDAEIIQNLGGTTLINALAWTTLLQKSSMGPGEVPSPLNKYVNHFDNLAKYLGIEVKELKTMISKRYANQKIHQLQAELNSAAQAQDLAKLSTTIQDYIIDTTAMITSEIYEKHNRFQREKDARSRVKAILESQRIFEATETVNDLIEKEQPIDAPNMINLIDDRISLAAANKNKKKKNKNKKKRNNDTLSKSTAHTDNNSSTTSTTKNDTTTTTTTTTNDNNNTLKRLKFQPPNPNSEAFYLEPPNNNNDTNNDTTNNNHNSTTTEPVKNPYGKRNNNRRDPPPRPGTHLRTDPAAPPPHYRYGHHNSYSRGRGRGRGRGRQGERHRGGRNSYYR